MADLSPQTTTPTGGSSGISSIPTSTAPAVKIEHGGVPVKRGRRSNPKVKTGCSNCKQRRIKCDEKRPACTQCVRSRKECTGYPAPSRSARPMAEIRIAPKPLVAAQAASISMQPTHQPTGIGIIRTTTVLPPRRANRRRRQHLAMLSTNAAMTSPTTYHPVDGLALYGSEVQYFDIFRAQTAAQLSGYFNSNFWTQRVLQECHSDAAIRHAVVALGALYKTLEQSNEPVSPGDPGAVAKYNSVMSHWQVAIKQYSEACNAMLVLNENSTSDRTRLMATILLACFDSFIGDHKQAIVQIQTGLGLLEQYQTGQSHTKGSATGYIEEDLVVLFTRLAIQAKSYDMAFHFPDPYVIRLSSTFTPQPSSPDSDRSSPSLIGSPIQTKPFESLVEARLASDKLCEALLLFIERLQIAKSDPSYVLPASWKRFGMGLKEQLNAWSEAFEPIFQSRMDPELKHLERSGIAALKMFQVNTNILFLMMFCDNEVQFDSFMPHFKTIVDLGWEVVGADERKAAAESCPDPQNCRHQHNLSKGGFRTGKHPMGHIQPSFSADLGIVPPLFVVATKCRDPRLRRQAIQLLRSSARREGMWDSELAANIGSWIMQVEEFDPNNPMPTEEYVYTDSDGISQLTIPEERRIMVKSVDFDLRARFADLQVGTRAAYKGAQAQDIRFKQTRIAW